MNCLLSFHLVESHRFTRVTLHINNVPFWNGCLISRNSDTTNTSVNTASYPVPLSRRHARKNHRLVHLVIERDRRYCRMCGADEESICPCDFTPVTLTVALKLSHMSGGRIVADNLRTICSSCADGLTGLAEKRNGLKRGYRNR